MTEPLNEDASDCRDVTAAVTHSRTRLRSSDALCQQYDRFRHFAPAIGDRVRDGDHILLHFADNRQLFAQCRRSRRHPSLVRIQKRNYPTEHLIGLPYGTILEQEAQQLRPILDPAAKLIPELTLNTPRDPLAKDNGEAANDNGEGDITDRHHDDNTIVTKDNRSLVDTNTAQRINYNTLMRMREEGMTGASIVATMIDNSTTYHHKTAFAQTKYVLRKQIKHQPRCRLVRCHAATIVEALYLKDPKRIRNLRDDTVGQILSYANVAAGRRVLVLESCLGLLVGAVAQRLGGYGLLFSLYEGQQPSYMDLLAKFNLSFAEMNSIKWVHCGDVFRDTAAVISNVDDGSHAANPLDPNAMTHGTDGPSAAATFDPANNNSMDAAMDGIETASQENANDEDGAELELLDRSVLHWPCELHAHTRQYLERQQAQAVQNGTDRPIVLSKSKAAHTIYSFLCKRAARFARNWLRERPCDSLILATRYDPTETLLQLFPYLAPSGPFVIYSEFIEPLTQCFRAIQENPKLLSINLRLSDTWMREYQILEGRTHPNMSMSQSGGFILTGIKLDPITGQNELAESVLKEIREQIGGRRARQKRKAPLDPTRTTKNSKKNRQTTQDNL
jgi:tRNA (adenine58-N1)-methyltransferase non-catalytic subunit